MRRGAERFTLTAIRPDAIDLPDVRVVAAPAGGGPAVEAALGVGPLIVGADPACDLVVTDARVSRRHCELTLGERGVVVRDLGSKNGTFVDGVQIVEAYVGPGSTLSAGDCRLLVRFGPSASRVPLSRGVRFGDALGGGVAMRALFAQLERAAPSDETLLLLGESGTGKELLARGVHERSSRRAGPFVVFDCTAVAPTLLESELFGHVRGAFTGASASRAGLLERARGGTLFIDELGELPLDLQPKLLRALESRQFRPVGGGDFRDFDARVVAATHRDLKARVAEGTFRQDLYYRLAVLELMVPPLRERREDIPLLVERFLASQSPPRSGDDLPPNALELLLSHAWPGNVRELRNVVTRLVLFPAALAGLPVGPQVAPTPAAPGYTPPAPSASPPGPLAGLPLREARDVVIENFERSYLVARLAEFGGNVSRMAEAAGRSRRRLAAVRPPPARPLRYSRRAGALSGRYGICIKKAARGGPRGSGRGRRGAARRGAALPGWGRAGL
ncbi:MAG: sigma 54-dependent Fis family transcriptional regulator [Polyangiaceae bacterium]|nr:sigma 54-dependent Fis family transcriptional regulator [Polyangiaceae bacterium]